MRRTKNGRGELPALDSERFYLRASAAYGLFWSTIVTVSLVFMVEVARLDPLQMLLVGAVLEGTVFVFEVPTGLMADAVSRRLSVIIGHALTGVGFLMLVAFPGFWMIEAFVCRQCGKGVNVERRVQC